MNKCCRSLEASLVDFQQFNLEFKCRVWRNDLSEPPITVGLCQIQTEAKITLFPIRRTVDGGIGKKANNE